MCNSTWIHTSPSIYQGASHPAKGLLWRAETRAASASPVDKILTPFEHTKTISDSSGTLAQSSGGWGEPWRSPVGRLPGCDTSPSSPVQIGTVAEAKLLAAAAQHLHNL